MNRTQLIQSLIDAYKLESYLEIGLGDPYDNFLKIHCKYKESCDFYNSNNNYDYSSHDPAVRKFIERGILTYNMSSDNMFFDFSDDKTFDLIFIDGLHTSDQVFKDICNSMMHLSPNGFIVCHDAIPLNEAAATKERHTMDWNGDVYRVFPILDRLGVKFNIVDLENDFGTAVIQYSYEFEQQVKFGMAKDEMLKSEYGFTYNDIFHNKIIRDKMMNVLTEQQFKDLYINNNVYSSK